jgi:N-acetylneuraminic acid mutarotase
VSAFQSCKVYPASQIRCIGGFSNSLSERVNHVIYSTQNGSWSAAAIGNESENPTRRSFQGLAASKGSYYMYGGVPNAPAINSVAQALEPNIGRISSEFWRYDVTANRWQRSDLASGPPELAQLALVTLSSDPNLVFAIGGLRGVDANNLQPLSEVWVYTVSESTWKLASFASDSRIPPSRRGHASCSYQNKVYIHGGTDYRGDVLFSDMWALSYDSQTSQVR